MDESEHIDMFRDLLSSGNCDLGTHLHPWCTRPMEEVIDDFHSHAINLPIKLFEQKMSGLTEQFQSCFNVHPFSFRAGRWGINGEQLAVLAALGYSVDSSIRPFYEDRYFSYTNAKTEPYWPSFKNCLNADNEQRSIMEIPASSGFNRFRFEFCEAVQQKLSGPVVSRFRLIGLLWQLGIMRKVTVTPEGNHWKDVCDCMDQCVYRGARVVNMFIHSSDLLPGGTPYVRSEKDKQVFMDSLARCVEHMQRKHNAQFLTIRQLYPKLLEKSAA